MIMKLLYVQPSELKFQIQFHKMSYCWVQLTNRTDQHVAFKVKTTHPKKYSVRPNVGIVSPGSSCVVKVHLQSQRDILQASYFPKDKFLIQSIVAPVGLSVEDITSQMFSKEKGKGLEEQKLRVVYVTADPPSPIPEASEEEYSSDASDYQSRITELCDSALTNTGDFLERFTVIRESDYDNEEQISPASVSTSEGEEQDLNSRDCDAVSKLIEERTSVILENQELHRELVMVRKHISRRYWTENFSILVVLLACFIGFIIGYILR